VSTAASRSTVGRAPAKEAPHLANPDLNPSFTKGIFMGEIREDLVFPFPSLAEDERESLRMIVDSFRAFAGDNIDSRQLDHDGRFTDAIRSGMAELGLMGLNIPEAYGGFGASAKVFNRVFGEIGATDPALCVYFGAHQSIGCKGITLFGTEEQKQRWLPGCASGETIAAFCLTEPGSGSDAQAMTTTAIPDADGTHYTLTGTKIWISNAPEADRYLVFATVDPSKGAKGITAFLVEKGTAGFRFGAHEMKMGIRACPAAELIFDGAVVPAANRLGEEGGGYRIALSSLAEGRISIGAACVGLARSALEQSAAYIQQRKAFGAPLSEQQGLKFMLAEMARDVASARSLVHDAARAKDRGEPIGEVSSLAKWTASDTAMKVATDAVQLFGGSGYSRETGIERLMRDAKGAQIYEGTNQIHRLIVADAVLGRAGSA
jgi:alkylation response protein AidB-like acyl-CoA dehydrogenase